MAEHQALVAARERAQIGIQKLRDALQKEFAGRSDIIVGVNGSYARQEVAEGSDVDIFFLGTRSIGPATEAQEIFVPKLEALGFKPPSPGGVFENALAVSAVRDNIGGTEDTNVTLTRRLLFLLEGEWLFNEEGFRGARTEIIQAYLRDTSGERHLCKYFLNDVVRYWRTICIDYEIKARFRSKARGIRYIKLRFSRLLLYFAGVLAVAETYDVPTPEKQAVLERTLAMNPIDRIRDIAGALAAPAIARYSEFLAALSDKDIRAELETLDPSYVEKPSFIALKESARAFREELIDILYSKYGPKHEVIKALLI
jgi:Nucleotidyltransferase domain